MIACLLDELVVNLRNFKLFLIDPVSKFMEKIE
jgi:hypothetical protein